MSQKNDANSAVVLTQLTHIQAASTKLYRPSRAREVISVDRSVPAWVESITTQTLLGFAEMKPIHMRTQDLALATFENGTNILKVGAFGAAYDIYDLELERAAATGLNVTNIKRTANQTASEQLIDTIAAVGDPYGMGLPGLANHASVPLTVASTKTAGGLTWAVATQAEILADLESLLFAVENNSLENYRADTIVLPQVKFQYAAGSGANKRSSFDQKSALEVFRLNHPDVRVVSWNKLKNAGAGGAIDRVVAFASAPEVARLVILKELSDSQPVRKHFGFEVAQEMRTAGVVIETPKAITYMDGV